MSRINRVTFDNVAVSAAQDLIEIKCPAGRMIRILHRWVGAIDTTLPTAQMLQLRERYLPATVTDGSGGSSPSPIVLDPGDTASTATCRANSTSKATTNGTAVQLWADGVHIYNGFDDELTSPYVIGPGEAYVFELESTVTGPVHLSGGVEFEEIGG